MKIYSLAPDGIFWTLQGEGAMRGQPMVFIRLAGCSVGCKECDTNYQVASRKSVDEILDNVLKIQLRHGRGPHWVWITGGEPTDHDLVPLVDGLRTIQCAVALATSGVRSVVGIDLSWLSVSPHSMDNWKHQSGTELKIIPGLNGLQLSSLPVGVENNFTHCYLQPLWLGNTVDKYSLEACRTYVLKNPRWALTDQGHKYWGLP